MSHKILNRYIVEKEIGCGAVGKVYKCRMINDESIMVAVKVVSLRKNKGKSSELLKEIKNEIDILKELDSPYVVKYIDFHATPENIYIVTEYLAGTELLDEILKDGYLTEGDVRKLIRQVILGINHSHEVGVIHRDIKAENIVFKDKECTEVKLIDFGLGVKGMEFASGIVGTPFYMAPELFSSKFYDKKYDVWSLGVLFYVMLCGYPPFGGDNNKEIIKKIQTAKLTFEHAEFDVVSGEAKDLIKKMLEKDPKKRISLPDALNHEFFNSTFTTLKNMDIESKNSNKIIKNLKSFKEANSFNKAIRICMSKIYEGSSIDKLKEIFLAADVDHNGKLDREEFDVVGSKLDMSPEETEMVWRALDSSGNGELEYTEFLAGCSMMDSSNMFVSASIVFGMMDKDNSKAIDFKEFKNFYDSQKISYDEAELHKIFDQIDTDGSGTIEYDEFCNSFKQIFDLE